MKTDSDTENWRKKYFDSLNSLEKEQQQSRVMEATLKRLAGRLCSASLGQSSQLDEQVRRLQSAIRREATSDELERITPALTEAIQALDHSTVPPAAVAAPPVLPAPAVVAAQSAETQPDTSRETMAADERVRAILAAQLAELRRDDELIEQVDALDTKLTASMTRDQLSDVLASLTELVGRRINRIERAKQETQRGALTLSGECGSERQFKKIVRPAAHLPARGADAE